MHGPQSNHNRTLRLGQATNASEGMLAMGLRATLQCQSPARHPGTSGSGHCCSWLSGSIKTLRAAARSSMSSPTLPSLLEDRSSLTRHDAKNATSSGT